MKNMNMWKEFIEYVFYKIGDEKEKRKICKNFYLISD